MYKKPSPYQLENVANSGDVIYYDGERVVLVSLKKQEKIKQSLKRLMELHQEEVRAIINSEDEK